MINTSSKKVHLVSLGCARNRVDSEVMLGTLLNKNWVYSDDPSECDAVIVNTCGFIQAAKEESIDKILEFADLKKSRPNLKLVVAGCLTQRYKSQLSQGLPEVDLFIGTDEFYKIQEHLDSETLESGAVFTKRTHYIYNENLPRLNTLTVQSAYVKVAEGCQHNCSFCIIPAIRGRLRSRPIDSVKKEVEQLVSKGVLEINLIAQDLAAYGRDHGQDLLLPLLRELVTIEGLKWIRLLYIYPENISDEFLDFFASEPKILKYLDIPVQHASDRLLKAMNRQVGRNQLETLFNKLRTKVPNITIRTSVMAGFPSETDADFEELRDFVEKVKFTHLGCFVYSKEEGTVAARMKDQIDEEISQKRQEKIMMLQQKISNDYLKNLIGKEFEALIVSQDLEQGILKGRLSFQAPEVDGELSIVFPRDQIFKDFSKVHRVKITKSFDYDLQGEFC